MAERDDELREVFHDEGVIGHDVVQESAVDVATWIGAGAGVVSAGGVPAAIYYARRQVQAAEAAHWEADMRVMRAELEADLRVQRAELEAEMRVMRAMGFGFGVDDETYY